MDNRAGADRFGAFGVVMIFQAELRGVFNVEGECCGSVALVVDDQPADVSIPGTGGGRGAVAEFMIGGGGFRLEFGFNNISCLWPTSTASINHEKILEIPSLAGRHVVGSVCELVASSWWRYGSPRWRYGGSIYLHYMNVLVNDEVI